MKEVRTAEHVGKSFTEGEDESGIDLARPEDLEALEGPERLAALQRWRRRQAQRWAEQDAAATMHPKPLGEQRSWPAPHHAHHEAPGKLTAAALIEESTPEAPVMQPAEALAYGHWLLAEERGWHHDEPAPGLQAAFSFLDRTAAPAAPAPARRGMSSSAPPVIHIDHRAPSRVAARLRPEAAPPAELDRDALLDAVLALVRADGPGQPLPAEVLVATAPALGDLGPLAARVRIHTSATAHQAASLLGAAAFTIGHDLYFASGEYAPGTPEGARLLRHELTHVLQHERGEHAAGRRHELTAHASAAEAEARAAEAEDWAGLRRSAPSRPDEARNEARAEVREPRSKPRQAPVEASGARSASRASESARSSVAVLLRAAGLSVSARDLEHLAASYQQGLSLSARRLSAGDAREQLAALVEHARGHAHDEGGHAPDARGHVPETNAPTPDARGHAPEASPPTPRAEPLDPATRSAVKAATGIELPDVTVELDAVLSAAGRLAEAVGPLIRIAPGVPGPDDAQGRKVRLHEAMHVAQQQATETNAPHAPADRTAAVEAEAHLAVEAAERGQPAQLATRAEPGTAYGLGAGDVVEAAANAAGIDPMAWLRSNVPAIGQLLSGGLTPLLAPIGQAAAATLRPMLDGLGMDSLGNLVRTALAPVGGGQLAFGVLTGCCECFGEALQRILTAFQGLLASDGAQGLRSWLEQLQTEAIGSTLDVLSDVFATLQRWGQPLIALIDAVSRGLDTARAVLGALADRAWRELVCPPLGLDPSLPPREALRRKLEELWQPIQQVIDEARRALEQLWQRLRQNPVVAKLLKLYDDVRRLMRAIQLCRESQSRDPQRWLAILSQETRGTIFENMIEGLQQGYDSVLDARDAAVNWILGVLDQLGILGAWNSAVPVLQQLGQALQSFVATVRTTLAAIRAEIERALTELSNALQKLWDAVRPYVSFAVGFAIAASALATGNPMPMISFLAGQAFLALPDCHKEHIANFVLDLFVTFVEFVPAQLPPLVLVKSAALSFLRTLRGAPAAQKIAAMDNLARILSFDAEVVAGFVVGVVEGLWASALGFVTQIAIFPMTIGLRALWSLGQLALDLGGRSFSSTLDSLDWLGEELSGATPLPEPGTFEGGPLGGGDSGATAEGGTRTEVRAIGRDEQPVIAPRTEGAEGAEGTGAGGGDDGVGFDPAPAFPELADPMELFNHVFRRGVTRQELESLLSRFNAGMEVLGARAGEQAASRLIGFFSARSTPYQVGEVLGEIVGWLAGEIIVIVATAGIGAAAVEAARGGVLLAQIGMRFPRLVQALGALRTALRPLLEVVGSLGDDFVRLFRQVMVWLEQLGRWAEQQFIRLLQWIYRNPRAAWRWYRRLRRLWGAIADDDDDELQAVAEEAASEAWDYLLANMSEEVKDEPAVRALLAVVHVARGGSIDVNLQVRHTSDSGWAVRATASANGDAVHADFGQGWIATADEGEAPWYATEDRHQQHLDLIEEVIAALIEPSPEEAEAEPEQAYQAKRRRAEELRTARVSLLLRGIRFLIEMEDWSGVESDLLIQTDFVITPNAERRRAQLRVQVANPYRARLRGNSVVGNFSDFANAQSEGAGGWDGYPPSSASPHPVNDHFRMPNDSTVPRPSGAYTITPGHGTEGAGAWREPWQAQLDEAREDYKAQLRIDHPDWRPRQLENEAKRMVEADYGGMSWPELYLVNWQGHHIKPINWNGRDQRTNLQFLRSTEHSPFTTWFVQRAAEIRAYVEGRMQTP